MKKLLHMIIQIPLCLMVESKKFAGVYDLFGVCGEVGPGLRGLSVGSGYPSKIRKNNQNVCQLGWMRGLILSHKPQIC